MAVRKKAKPPKATVAMVRNLYLRLAFDSTQFLLDDIDNAVSMLTAPGANALSMQDIADRGVRLLGRAAAVKDALAVARHYNKV